MPSAHHRLSSFVLACTLPAQAAPAPKKEPPPPAASNAGADPVLRGIDLAQRELRTLMQRNAELERQLAELRASRATSAPVVGDHAPEAAASAGERQQLVRLVEAQTKRAEDAEAAHRGAEAEAARWRHAYETLRLGTDQERARAGSTRDADARALHDLRAEHATLRKEHAALLEEIVKLRQAVEAALRARKTTAADQHDGRAPAARRRTEPAPSPQPAPGAKTPRRRGKID